MRRGILKTIRTVLYIALFFLIWIYLPGILGVKNPSDKWVAIAFRISIWLNLVFLIEFGSRRFLRKIRGRPEAIQK